MQIIVTLLALLVGVLTIVHATPVEFEFALTGPFSARTGHTLVSWHGSELLLMGGDDGIVGIPNVRNDIYRSRDGGRSWELLIDHAPWAARELHVALSTPSAIYVIAGGSAKYAFPDVWRSVDGGRTWELRSRGTAPFGIRTYASGCAVGEQLFLIGGSDGAQALSDVWTSIDGGQSWSKIAENQFRARLGHSAVCLDDGGIVVIGGMLNSASSGILSDEVFRSDDKGLTWSQIAGHGITDPDAHFSARAQHAAVSMSGSLVIVGGLTYGPQAFSDMWESRDGGRSWALLGESSIFETEFAPRYGHQIASLSSGEAVLVGGLAGKGFPLADVHKFRLAPVNAKTNTRSYIMHGKRRVHILDAEIGYLFFPDLILTPSWSPSITEYAVSSPNPVPAWLPNQQIRVVHSGNAQSYSLSFYTNGAWVASTIQWSASGTGQFPSPYFNLTDSLGITAVRITVTDQFSTPSTKDYTITIRGGSATPAPPLNACPNDAVQWSVQDSDLCDSSCTLKLWTYNFCYRTSTGQTVPLSCCNNVTKPNPLVPCTLSSCMPSSTLPPSATTATPPTGPTTAPGTAPAVLPSQSGPKVYSYTAVPVDVCEGFCSIPNVNCNGPCGGGYQRNIQQCVDVRGQAVDESFCIAESATPLTSSALYKPCTINTLCTDVPAVSGSAQCSSIEVSVGALAPNFDSNTLVYGLIADSFLSFYIRAVSLGGDAFEIFVNDQSLSAKSSGSLSDLITVTNNTSTKITVRCYSALNFRDYFINVTSGNVISYSWTQVPSGICSRSCTILDDLDRTVVPATMNSSAACLNNFGVKVDDSLCSGSKPMYASTSCNVGVMCSQNTYLSSIDLLNFNGLYNFLRDGQQYVFKPSCSADRYTQITPTLDDPKATIYYWKTGGFYPVPVTPIANTATSAGIRLENRLNIIQIQVIAHDQITQRTYFFYIDFSECPDPVTTADPSASTTTTTPTPTTTTTVSISSTTTTAATTTYTTTTGLISTSTASVAGDPQIKGLQGQDFQVHGTPDEIFNMVSHPDYQINSRFIFLGKGSSRCIDRYTACWTHPGTYIDVLGFNVRTHKIRVNAGKYEDGLRVYINEKEINPLDNDINLGNGMSISFKRRREVSIRTSLFIFSAVNSDNFLNQNIQLLDEELMRIGSIKTRSGINNYPLFPLHGILGQTWKNIIYHHGKGPQIEGHVDDYRIDDQDIYGDSFYFNQFKN